MLRVLGLPQRTMAGAYALEFLLAGLAASGVGVGLGWGCTTCSSACWRAGGCRLPAPSAWPALAGLGLGLTLLVAFGLPPVLQLAQVPPLRVLRRDVGALKAASLAVLALGVLGFAALLLALSRDRALGLIAVGGFAGAAALFAALAWGAVALLRRLVHEQTAPRWLVLATRQLAARPVYAVVQVSSLAVGLLALVLLVLLRTDLIDSWRQATPPDAPNRFVINIMPDQAEAFRHTVQQAGAGRMDWYPMFRGRLVAVNGQAVPGRYADERAAPGRARVQPVERRRPAAAQRDRRRPLAAGRGGCHQRRGGPGQTLGLKLGDTLRFDVGGMPVEARITSLRKVDWASMRVNFFVMFPRADMPELPVTYIAAYRAPARAGFDNALVRQFPNITNVDTAQSIAQVQRVLDQVIGAVQFLFGFTLAAGLLVLLAAVGATREERAREFAIMRAVGASGQLLRQVAARRAGGRGPAGRPAGQRGRDGHGLALARQVFDFSWRRRPGWPWSARWPARCWRWWRAGGACARCCAARWCRRFVRPPIEATRYTAASRGPRRRAAGAPTDARPRFFAPPTLPDAAAAPRRKGIYVLPNMITLAALFGGFYAIVMAMNGHFGLATAGIFAAMVLDSLDGRVARMTRTQSAFGEQMDSLSDMVSFGAAPALVAYVWALQPLGKAGWFAAFVYCACAALRLARFNVNTAVVDKRYFQGCPRRRRRRWWRASSG
jgi:CDP-diacylglycerol--serine O-phosphatidyltransferase